jgi:hypothetical protein
MAGVVVRARTASDTCTAPSNVWAGSGDRVPFRAKAQSRSVTHVEPQGGDAGRPLRCRGHRGKCGNQSSHRRGHSTMQGHGQRRQRRYIQDVREVVVLRSHLLTVAAARQAHAA